MGELLRKLGYNLQTNVKTEEGASHPDRDAQFTYINTQVKRHPRGGDPVISVDTTRRLLIPNRTSSRESPSLYLPRRYKVYLQERDGSTDLAYSRSLPRGSWSRKRAHCRECGTQDRPHGGNGLCSRCFSRNWARGTPTVPYR